VDGLLSEFTAAPVQAKIAVADLALALTISAVTDLRERRIPNAVTYPALAVAAACAISLGGLPLLLSLRCLGCLEELGEGALTHARALSRH